MSGTRIVPLARAHRPLLREFRSQHPSLVEYLQRYALRHLEKDLLSRTYVAIDAQQRGQGRLAGYFSLCAVSVEHAAAAAIPALRALPRFPIPGVLLARLAVDERVQNQGLGRYLFDEALGLTLALATDGPIALRLFVADAIDESAARFYARRGFESLSPTYPARMALDLKPLLDKSRAR